MTSRKVVTRSGRKFRGYFPSKKLNRMVEWESLLERDAILFFEFSSGVVDYQEQPEVIYYEQEGEIRRYHPDFALTLRNDRTVHVEVKPASQLQAPSLAEKFKAITERYANSSAHFRILTDQLIRQEPRLSNLKRLASIAQYPFEAAEVSRCVREVLSCGPGTSLYAVTERIGMKNMLSMIANHHLYCDLNLDLHSPNNFVRLTEEADHDAILI